MNLMVITYVVAFLHGGNMGTVSTVLTICQLALAFCNLCIMGYVFYKFISKPHDTMGERVLSLEIEVKDIKNSLLQGNDKFREQDETNQVVIRSVLALVEFEMQYCLVEHKDMSDGLRQAKKDLNEYLARK